MNILSARYANADHSAAILDTKESGAVAVSEVDAPDLWAAMLKWGAPAAYVAPPALEPVQSPEVRLAEILIAEGVITAAKAQKVRDRLKSPSGAPRAIKGRKTGTKRRNG